MKALVKILYPLMVFLLVFLPTYVYFHGTATQYRVMLNKPEPTKMDLGLDSKNEAGIEEIELPSYDIDFKLIKAVDKLQRREEAEIGPVNFETFRYMLNPKNTCDGFQNTLTNVLVLVKSAPDHQRLRQWLRLLVKDTIGSYAKNMRLLFLLGFSKKMNSDIKAEYTKYGDIVQRNFIDTYRNLTYKTQMGYDWATAFCSSASFIMFQDDDFFINVKNVFNFLSKQYKPEDVFTGRLVKSGASVVRDRASKWFVSNIVFSNEAFPSYLPGGSYLVSAEIGRRLSLAFPYVPNIPVDDVYVGLVASKLGITLKYSALFDFSDCQNWNNTLACKAFL
jgi:hypothetical protein